MTKGTFAKKLINYRTKHNLSQTELAALLNVAYVTVNRWERGWREPSRLAKLAIEQLLKNEKTK